MASLTNTISGGKYQASRSAPAANASTMQVPAINPTGLFGSIVNMFRNQMKTTTRETKNSQTQNARNNKTIAGLIKQQLSVLGKLDATLKWLGRTISSSKRTTAPTGKVSGMTPIKGNVSGQATPANIQESSPVSAMVGRLLLLALVGAGARASFARAGIMIGSMIIGSIVSSITSGVGGIVDAIKNSVGGKIDEWEDRIDNWWNGTKKPKSGSGQPPASGTPPSVVAAPPATNPKTLAAQRVVAMQIGGAVKDKGLETQNLNYKQIMAAFLTQAHRESDLNPTAKNTKDADDSHGVWQFNLKKGMGQRYRESLKASNNNMSDAEADKLTMEMMHDPRRQTEHLITYLTADYKSALAKSGKDLNNPEVNAYDFFTATTEQEASVALRRYLRGEEKNGKPVERNILDREQRSRQYIEQYGPQLFSSGLSFDQESNIISRVLASAGAMNNPTSISQPLSQSVMPVSHNDQDGYDLAKLFKDVASQQSIWYNNPITTTVVNNYYDGQRKTIIAQQLPSATVQHSA